MKFKEFEHLIAGGFFDNCIQSHFPKRWRSFWSSFSSLYLISFFFPFVVVLVINIQWFLWASADQKWSSKNLLICIHVF